MTDGKTSALITYGRRLLGELPGGWRYVQLGDLEKEGIITDIQDGNHGEKHPKSSDYVASGIPFVMARDLIDERLALIHCNFITRQQAECLRIGFARPGDVLLTHKATMGSVAIVPKGHDFIMLTPQITYYRIGNKARLDESFLKYVFLSPAFQYQLNASSDQSTRKYIGISAQRNLWIPLPPANEQRAIAHILGTLDDKIELNRRMNETLEAMARAIFKSWFVDFDPVRAKAEGRQPAGMDAATAALFPDAFQESPLGKIPKGWRVSPIGDALDAVGGSTPSTEEPAFWDGEISFCTPKDMAPLRSPVLIDTERRITESGLQQISSGQLPKGTVLLSSRAPIGYLAVTEIPVTVNQGIIAMICDKELPNLYVLHWAKENMDTIIANANGTTFLEISKRNFRPIQALVPPPTILSKFMEAVVPMYKRIVNNIFKSKTLSQIRDGLLPNLISGEVRIMTTERILSKKESHPSP